MCSMWTRTCTPQTGIVKHKWPTRCTPSATTVRRAASSITPPVVTVPAEIQATVQRVALPAALPEMAIMPPRLAEGPIRDRTVDQPAEHPAEVPPPEMDPHPMVGRRPVTLCRWTKPPCWEPQPPPTDTSGTHRKP
uniref:(northern house mosquito) hypothetical protein n=1 Tax=Culex pipiens TaxID=7175 RepID=A0A8D8HTB9_CULPI